MPGALDSVVVVLRAAVFIALLQAAGTAVFLFLFRDLLAESRHAVRALGVTAAALGAALLVARYLFEPARMMGSLSGLADGAMHGILAASNVSVTQAIRLLGAAMVIVALRGNTRAREALALVGATLIAVSFSFMGHTAASDQRWLLGVLLIVHVMAAAFWFGALVPLYVVCGRESLPTTAEVMARFSDLAVRIVPLIFVAGLGMTLALLPGLAWLASPYGRLIVFKILAFTALMGLAAWNKVRLGPAVAAGSEASLLRLRRSVATEAFLIGLVLVATSAMTTLYSPDQ